MVAASLRGLPVYRVTEGVTVAGFHGHFYPYDPGVLHVHAGRPFAIRLHDHVGGCELDTDFPGLGEGGGTAVADVPVGATRTIVLEAPRPGTYTYHCGVDMYSGKIVAS